MTEVGSSDNAARRVASDGRFMATWLICFLFTNKTRTDDSVRHLLVFLSAHNLWTFPSWDAGLFLARSFNEIVLCEVNESDFRYMGIRFQGLKEIRSSWEIKIETTSKFQASSVACDWINHPEKTSCDRRKLSDDCISSLVNCFYKVTGLTDDWVVFNELRISTTQRKRLACSKWALVFRRE